MRRTILFSTLTLLACLGTTFAERDLLGLIPLEPRHSDKLEREIAEYRRTHFEAGDISQLVNDMFNFAADKAFVCTGGVDPAKMARKDYLQAFADGPCAPTVMIPGISGAKLVATIDCPVFKAKNPELFKTCGWTACSGFFKRKPKSEYTLWIPGLFSPVSLIGTNKARECFAGFMHLSYQLVNGQFTPEESPGVTVTPYGESPKTRKNSECGFHAMEDLAPLAFQPKRTFKEWKLVREAFQKAGFVTGLTLQAMPYDWRLSYEVHKLDTRFQKTIELMHEATGKKVVTVGHSMGNFQILHNLWKMTQAWKDTHIARYIDIAGPLLGATQTFENPVGLDPSIFIKVWFVKAGLPADAYKASIPRYPSIWQLMAKPIFSKFADAPWMKAILQRIKEEESGAPVTSGTIMDMFPSYTEECNPGFKTRKAGCYTGLRRMTEFGSINGEPLNSASVKSLLQKYSFLGAELAGDLYDYAQDERFDEMHNPGVQTSIIYSNILDTNAGVVYDSDPKPRVVNNEFVVPDKILLRKGDKTVETTSAITAGIKWAQEFNDGLEGSRPVNIVELCSDYKRRSSVFEDAAAKTVSNNAYFGVDCTCRGTKDAPTDGENCTHGSMLQDAGVINFMLNSVIDGQKGAVSGRFSKMTESELDEFVNNCDLFLD